MEFLHMLENKRQLSLTKVEARKIFNLQPRSACNDSKPFIWEKKFEKEGKANLSHNKKCQEVRRIKHANQEELDGIRQRKTLKEMEKEAQEMTNHLIEKKKNEDQFIGWLEDEDQFELNRLYERSSIRILNGRGKPIDFLANYLTAERNSNQTDLKEPHQHLRGLTLTDLEDLRQEIETLTKLDKSSSNLMYWKDLSTIVDEEIRLLISGTNQSEDMKRILSQCKSVPELLHLQDIIENKIAERRPGVDVSFWEVVLTRLKSCILHTQRLRDRHQEYLKRQLKSQQNELIASPKPNPDNQLNATPIDVDQDEKITDTDYYWEPDGIYVNPSEIYSNQKIRSPEEDMVLLEQARTHVLNSVQSAINDGTINSELWSNKYHPRKPRFLNRVLTGFEWNKYNRTHYDTDNPPPKMVQGYKFNIFYPDLVDKNVTPTYSVTPCEENNEFAVLRFKAGPPYEDVAFNIVNREWDKGYKSGFKSQYSHNNGLQLWFNFKRLRYRR